MLSYVDRLSFGITADYDSTPDMKVMVDGIESALAAGMRAIGVITTHKAADLQRATAVQPVDKQIRVTIGQNGSPRLRIDVP